MNPLFATRFFDLPSSLFVHGNHFCVENECHHVCVRGTQISKKEACDNDEIFLIEDAFIAFSPINHLATEHRILQTLYYVVMKPFGKSFDLFIDAIVELNFDYDDYLLHYQHKHYGTISNYCVKMKPSRYIYEAELDVYFEKGFLPVRLEGIADSCAFSLNDPKNQNAYFSTLETLHPHPKFIHSWVVFILLSHCKPILWKEPEAITMILDAHNWHLLLKQNREIEKSSLIQASCDYEAPYDIAIFEENSYDAYYDALLKRLFPANALYMKAMQVNATMLLKQNIFTAHKVLTYMKTHKGEEWLLERIYEHSFYGKNCESVAYAFERYMQQNSRWTIPSLALENFDQLSLFFSKVSDIELEAMDKFFSCQLEFSKPEEHKRIYNSYGMMYPS